MVFSIVIGLLVWMVLPMLLENAVKKKAHKKALRTSCAIVGIAIIAAAVVNGAF